MRVCHGSMVYTYHEFMIQQTLPGHIHRPGSVYLRHLGESGGVSGVRGTGRFAGFLFQPPHMLALPLGRTFGLCLARLACLDCHVSHLLIKNCSSIKTMPCSMGKRLWVLMIGFYVLSGYIPKTFFYSRPLVKIFWPGCATHFFFLLKAWL